MNISVSLRAHTQRYFVLLVLVAGIISIPSYAEAAITDGLTVTVNREAVSASALVGALVEVKCNAGSYTTLGTTNGSGVVSVTDVLALGTLLTNAGSCIVGSSLDIRVTKDGYVTQEKLGAITLLDAANAFTFTGSDAVKFGHKATITREGDGAALTGATVGVGATLCIESGTLGIYYCPVPLASDGAALSIAKTGYVTNTASSVSDRTTNADAQGTLSPSNLLFQVKISVADELGNSITPTTITFGGTTETASSSNVFYFAPSTGTNQAVVVTKTGFIPSATTNTALADVSASTAGQTAITLGTSASSSSAIVAGATQSLLGLQYALKSLALKSELGGTITGIASGTLSSPSTDVSVTGSGGVSVAGTAVTGNVLYIAATGNGSGDDTLTITLSGVTVDGGSANGASLVSATTTDAGNLLNALTGQTTFGIGQATGNLQVTSGFGYPLKVTVTDELGTAIPASTLTTETLGGTAAYVNVSNTAYFASTASGGSLVIAKNGYVSAATTNTGLATVTANQATTTSITFGTGSTFTSVVSAGGSVSAQGLPFAQKITVETELAEALTGTTVSAGSSATVCTVVSSTAYCPVPFSEDGTSNDISIAKSGYVSNTAGDTVDRAGNTTAQQLVSVTGTDGVKYALKIVVNDSAGTPVTGATVTHGGVSAASVVSNAYYFTTNSAGALIVTKSGFDSTDTAIDTGLANVGVTSSGQTAVTLTGSTPFTGNLSSGGSSAAARGLVATISGSVGGSVGSGGSGGSSSSGRGRSGQNVSSAQPSKAPASSAAASTSGTCSFSRDLKKGDQGTDVAALQTILEAKGHLAMPAGASKGTFGSLTQAAVAKLQASVGVPQTGYFGPMTRATACVSTSAAPAASVAPVTIEAPPTVRDLTLGMTGDDVRKLQAILLKENKGTKAAALAGVGASGYFGTYTRDALAEHQTQAGIAPAQGYFGPATRAHMRTKGLEGVWW